MERAREKYIFLTSHFSSTADWRSFIYSEVAPEQNMGGSLIPWVLSARRRVQLFAPQNSVVLMPQGRLSCSLEGPQSSNSQICLRKQSFDRTHKWTIPMERKPATRPYFNPESLCPPLISSPFRSRASQPAPFASLFCYDPCILECTQSCLFND